MPKRILFHRNYSRYTGGHQKVRDYIAHISDQPDFEVWLCVNNTADVQSSLFDNIPNVQYKSEYTPQDFELVFLAGLDWREYLPRVKGLSAPPKVINLIQHMRHSEPKHPLFKFLQYPATRLCVSHTVQQAIAPHANGECIHIPMGHHVPPITIPKEYDLYILANKRPAWGKELAQWANSKGIRVKLHSEFVPKQAVLNAMAQARISVCLPNPTEGFYLPGIEAMKLSDIAIVPNCKANQEYKRRFDNLIICPQNTPALQEAIERALLNIKKPWLFAQKLRGGQTVKQYSLAQEKQSFLRLLRNVAHLQ